MRAALALYLARLGAWLLSNATACPVTVTLDVRDDSDELFGGWLLSRSYGFPERPTWEGGK